MSEEPKEKRTLNPKTKKLIIIVACVFVIAAIVTTVIIIALSRRENVGDILALGDRYMSEMDYESAIREYRHAIEIDPKSEDAYIKLAEAYVAMGDIDSAIKALEEGYEATQSERILERLNELRREMHTPEKATKMTVATEPDKLTYFVGETLDLTGLTFTVTYDDGMTEEIIEGYTCDVITLEESGSVEITVKYGEIEATVNVIVYEDGKGGSGEKEPSTDPVTTESSTTEPTTTEPTTTEPTTTEPTTTEPMTTEPLTTESTTTESTTTKAPETTTTESTTMEAPVTSAPEPAVLTGISIKTQPAKTTYYIGDTLDTSGLTLTATYSDGKTETVTNGFTCSPTTLNMAGTQEITVTYGSKTATFNVTVAAVTLTGISIKTQPTKTSYYVGDTLDTSGLALTAAYSDGRTETVTSDFTCSPTTLNTAGTQKITVTYGGKTTTFNVTVMSNEPTLAEDFTWTLENGVLTLSGHGLMPDWIFFALAPWQERSDEIKKVVINNGILNIGDYAFDSCTSLKSITIPEGVTSIGDHAFCDCSNLISITIPDSVTVIGPYAFNSCTSLTSITLPDSVTSIEDSAFSNCSSLTSIKIPDGVTSIGNGAFWSCESLTAITIPSGVTRIGENAFRFCRSLKSVMIPASVMSVGINPFAYCTMLTEIAVEQNNTNYCAVGGVLFSKDMTTLIACPAAMSFNYNIPNKVRNIGEDAFGGCANLKSITIPDSVTNIGAWAFDSCFMLTSITIPDSVTRIGDNAFWGCSSLISITIPDSVTRIGDNAFWGCSYLISITIPDSVTFIGDDAFERCPNLTIHGHAGSYAEQYAKDNDIPFVAE